MNGHCSTCDVEKQCGYQYKPCDCCNYRKFKPLPLPPESLFELWWAEYLPEATQARAFEAWSRAGAAPQPAQGHSK